MIWRCFWWAILASCLTVHVVAAQSGAAVQDPATQLQEESEIEVGDDSNTAADLAALVEAGFGPYHHDDEFGDFSVERAAQFLDRVAVTWGDTFGCVTCHTNGYYLTAPNTLFNDRPAFHEAREQAETFVRSWKSGKSGKPGEPEADREEEGYGVEDTYVVSTAAFLAINNRQAGEDLSPVTVQALDQAWSIQDEEGHWPGWFKCNWPPFESDDHFGVTLMAIAMGMAPESYSQTDAAIQGMAKIKRYVETHPPEHNHHRAMLLWAGRYHDALVDDVERRRWIQEFLDLQRSDGGWASGDLGAWRQREGEPSDPWVGVESDGYGTAFVIYALRQAGVPASHPALQKGVGWLKANQRASGYWWTQSLRTIRTPRISSPMPERRSRSRRWSKAPSEISRRSFMRGYLPGVESSYPSIISISTAAIVSCRIRPSSVSI